MKRLQSAAMAALRACVGLLLVPVALLPSQTVAPTGYVRVTASKLFINPSNGSLISGATATFTPSTCGGPGSAVGGRPYGGGQFGRIPVKVGIANGGFASTVILVDTGMTAPGNLCFDLQIKDDATGKLLIGGMGQGYEHLQPAATSNWCAVTNGETVCNLDNYTPDLAGLPTFNRPQPGTGGGTGTPGTAATVSVGSTATGAAGTQATVTNTGTGSAAVLNFMVPRGADGTNGLNGTNGTNGAAATVSVGATTTGAAGTQAIVTNTGNSQAAVLAFTVPRGADGATGATGPAPAGTGLVKTTSGVAGLATADLDYATPALVSTEATRAQTAEAALVPGAYTVATLPVAAAGNVGRLYLVTDGVAGVACTTGGGTTYAVRALCQVYLVSSGVYGYRIASQPALEKGIPNGIAALDANGSVKGSQMAQTFSNLSRFWLFGTSFAAGAGASRNGYTDLSSLISRDIPAPVTNLAVSGANISYGGTSVYNRFFSLYEPDPVFPDLLEFDGMENDNTTCNSATAACGIQAGLMMQGAWAMHAIRPSNRRMASACTAAAGWSTDTTLGLGTPTLTNSTGTPMGNANNTYPLTCSVPANATKIGWLYKAVSSGGGTGTWNTAVDGVNQTDELSGTTTYSITVGSNPGLNPGILRQEMTPTYTGSAHTVTITNTSGANIVIVGVDWMAPGSTYNPTLVNNIPTVTGAYANASVWNTVTANRVAQMGTAGGGLPIYLVDLVNGTPGMNTAADFQTTSPGLSPSGAPWKGSLFANHPGDLGQWHWWQTIQSTMTANGLSLMSFGFGGKTVDRDAKSRLPFTFTPPYVDTSTAPHSTYFWNLLDGVNVGTPTGFDDYHYGNVAGWAGNFSLTGSGKPWSGQLVHGPYGNGTYWWFCNMKGTGDSTAVNAASNYTVANGGGCIDPAGNGYLNFIVQPVGTAVASAATIAVSGPVVHVTGTAAISTLTVPGVCAFGGYACTVTLIPDGAFTTGTSGNISIASTAVVGRPLVMLWDQSQSKWYPSY